MTEVETQGEDLTFTFNLPRQVMTGIKNVVFLDAKGQPVEGRRTSSGYRRRRAVGIQREDRRANADGEFEAWQGSRTVKVPFKVRAGLGVQ